MLLVFVANGHVYGSSANFALDRKKIKCNSDIDVHVYGRPLDKAAASVQRVFKDAGLDVRTKYYNSKLYTLVVKIGGRDFEVGVAHEPAFRHELSRWLDGDCTQLTLVQKRLVFSWVPDVERHAMEVGDLAPALDRISQGTTTVVVSEAQLEKPRNRRAVLNRVCRKRDQGLTVVWGRQLSRGAVDGMEEYLIKHTMVPCPGAGPRRRQHDFTVGAFERSRRESFVLRRGLVGVEDRSSKNSSNRLRFDRAGESSTATSRLTG